MLKMNEDGMGKWISQLAEKPEFLKEMLERYKI